MRNVGRHRTFQTPALLTRAAAGARVRMQGSRGAKKKPKAAPSQSYTFRLFTLRHSHTAYGDNFGHRRLTKTEMANIITRGGLKEMSRAVQQQEMKCYSSRRRASARCYCC